MERLWNTMDSLNVKIRKEKKNRKKRKSTKKNSKNIEAKKKGKKKKYNNKVTEFLKKKPFCNSCQFSENPRVFVLEPQWRGHHYSDIGSWYYMKRRISYEQWFLQEDAIDEWPESSSVDRIVEKKQK